MKSNVKMYATIGACALMLAGCGRGGVVASDEPQSGIATDVDAVDASVADYTATISFSKTSAIVAGSGAEVTGTEVIITENGSYLVSGEADGARLLVSAGLDDVRLVLSGVTLANEGESVIRFEPGASGTIDTIADSSITTIGAKHAIEAKTAEDADGNELINADGTATGGNLVFEGTAELDITATDEAVSDDVLEYGSIYGEGIAQIDGDCDAVHVEGNLDILSGDYHIDATDDAFHADRVLTVGTDDGTGPRIWIDGAQEGLEGATVRLLGGEGFVFTSDDGVNAANSDLYDYGWHYSLEVVGGTWTVVAFGDGLDSNGDLLITGGVTEVYCLGNGDGAVDFGEGMEGEVRGTFEVTGGELFALGSDMLVTPSVGSYKVYQSQFSEHDIVEVRDNDEPRFGTTLYGDGSYILYASGDDISGYVLTADGETVEATTDFVSGRELPGFTLPDGAPNGERGVEPPDGRGPRQ